MKILTKYVIKETLYPMLVGTAFFTFAFVLELLPRVINMIVNKGAPFFKSLELFVYMLPFNVATTIPMAVLMASITSFSRLSGDNEVVAMKALTFPTMRIYKPIILFGIIAFIFSLFFNNVIMPETNYRYRALTIYIVNIKPSLAVEAMQFMKIPDTSQYIGAEDADGDNVRNVVVYDGSGKNNQNYRIITASDGKWSDNDVNSSLIKLRLQNGMIQDISKIDSSSNEFTTFDTLDINFPRTVQNTVGGHERGLRELPFWKIREQISKLEKERKETIESAIKDNVLSAYNQSEKNETLDEFEKKYIKDNKSFIKQIKSENKQIVPYYYYIEFQKCFSIPAACFFVVFVGAPLGLVSKRSGKGGGFAISVLVIAIYYSIMVGSETLARTGIISPSMTMWIPNIVLFAIGLTLMIRSIFERGK